MERVLTPTDADELLAATIAVYSLPRPIRCVDALVSIPGQRENGRVIEPIRWWQEGKITARFLLIAGQNELERRKGDLDLDRLRRPPFNLFRTEGVTVEPGARHTRDQADWVADQVRERGITSLALFVTPYHMLRAYLTLLKSLEKRGITIPIFPAPTWVDLSNLSPETGEEMWQLIPGEARRIPTYQEKGDVATPKELKVYLSWLYRNMMFSQLSDHLITRSGR